VSHEPAATHEALERERPEWRTWLAVLAEAREAMLDPLWSRAVPVDDPALIEPRAAVAPLLHGVVLRLDPGGAEGFVRRVFSVAADVGDAAEPLRAAADAKHLDALGLLQAVISREGRSLDACAVRLHVPADVLSAVAAVASVPLLHAVRRAWEGRVPSDWSHGYCPICGEWAALAEARGLERRRRLRCARCGGDWRGDWLRCVYCANTDHTTLGLFAPDAALDTRTIETCRRCGGYVKTLGRLQGTAAEAVALLDLATVELDIAALVQGFARPAEPACDVSVRVVPAIA
jgi:FdhE protein